MPRLVVTPGAWRDHLLDLDPDALAFLALLSLEQPDSAVVLLEVLDEGAAVAVWSFAGARHVDPHDDVATIDAVAYCACACPCEACAIFDELLTVRRRYRLRVPRAVVAAAELVNA